MTIVIPCYNEQAAIPSLLERLDNLVRQFSWDVVFVNDGSTDRTSELLTAAAAARPWMRILRHQQRMGLGAALRTGFTAPLAPIVCTIDSDCTYPPERLPELIAAVRRGADIVTASPWHPANREAEGSWLRVLPSRAVSWLYRQIAGAGVHTFTCLFRAYRREVIEQVEFAENGFAAVAEILVRAVRDGFHVEEVPMPLTARRHGVSKMSTTAAVAGHLKLLAKTAQWTRARRSVTRA